MATAKKTTTKAVTTQGTKTAAGVVNYNPNTGAKLKAGESVTVNAGGNTYGSNQSRSYDSQYTSGSPTNPQVNAENINTKAMNVPPPPVGENYMGTLLGANTGLDNQALGTTTDKKGVITTNPIEPTAQADGGLGDIYKQYQELSNNLQKDAPSAESIYNKSLKESGLRQYQQEAQNYSSQINAITAKAQADMLSTTGQGRGIPEAIIGGQQAQISKEAAIQALPLQALLANAQGNVELAQSHLDTLFKIRFEDAKTKHEYKTKLLDSAMQVASKQEQRQYEDIKLNEARKYNETQDLNTLAQTYAKEAFSNGQSKLGAQISQLDYKSPTFKQDLAKLQAQLRDPVQVANLAKLNAEINAMNATTAPGAVNEDLNAYASQYSDTGKLPTPAELKLSGLTVGQVTAFAKQTPKPKGAIVSTNTGSKSSTLSPTEEDGITAMTEIIQQTLPALKEKFGTINTGLLGGIGGKIITSQDRQDYLTYRQEFLNKLLKARSGATVTPQEYDRYAKMLPGTFNQTFFLGADGMKKLNSLETAMNSSLSNTLNSKQQSVYGYSKVKVGDKERTVGEVIDIGGENYRVLPDGTLTDIL